MKPVNKLLISKYREEIKDKFKGGVSLLQEVEILRRTSKDEPEMGSKTKFQKKNTSH